MRKAQFREITIGITAGAAIAVLVVFIISAMFGKQFPTSIVLLSIFCAYPIGWGIGLLSNVIAILTEKRDHIDINKYE